MIVRIVLFYKVGNFFYKKFDGLNYSFYYRTDFWKNIRVYHSVRVKMFLFVNHVPSKTTRITTTRYADIYI